MVWATQIFSKDMLMKTITSFVRSSQYYPKYLQQKKKDKKPPKTSLYPFLYHILFSILMNWAKCWIVIALKSCRYRW